MSNYIDNLLKSDTFLSKMIEYQIKNDIRGKCLCNTLYTMKQLKDSNLNCEAKAVISIFIEDGNVYYTSGHLVVDFEDVIVDASYEVIKRGRPDYYDSIQKFLEDYPIFKKNKSQLKEIIDNHMYFVKLQNEVNKNFESYSVYGEMADYLKNLSDYC